MVFSCSLLCLFIKSPLFYFSFFFRSFFFFLSQINEQFSSIVYGLCAYAAGIQKVQFCFTQRLRVNSKAIQFWYRGPDVHDIDGYGSFTSD